MLLMWLGIAVPLVFFGAALGHHTKPFTYPCTINKVPKPIKPQKCVLNTKVVMTVGGLLPFAAIIIELSFIMDSMWSLTTFYYMFVFLFFVVQVLIITSAEISIVMTYF